MINKDHTEFENIVYMNANLLIAFIKEVFIQIGVPEFYADTLANYLISFDIKKKNSEGIERFKTYYEKIKKGIYEPTQFGISGYATEFCIASYYSNFIPVNKKKRSPILCLNKEISLENKYLDSIPISKKVQNDIKIIQKEQCLYKYNFPF